MSDSACAETPESITGRRITANDTIFMLFIGRQPPVVIFERVRVPPALIPDNNVFLTGHDIRLANRPVADHGKSKYAVLVQGQPRIFRT